MLRGHKADARRLVRYVMLVQHIYYLSIDGPMNQAKWALCEERGLVTPVERADLEPLEEVPAAIAVSALEIVYTLNRERILSDDHAVRMETEISEARRLASRQQDYHESPIPMPFFHLMTIMTHSFLITMEWNSAVRLTVGIHSDDGVRMSEVVGVATLVISLNTLRRVAIAMTNPFGDDETDYDLDHDLRRLWRQCEQTMERMPEDGETLRTSGVIGSGLESSGRRHKPISRWAAHELEANRQAAVAAEASTARVIVAKGTISTTPLRRDVHRF